MDDRTMHGPRGRAVIRRCEATRFQQELLARAYRQVAGDDEARRTLINRAAAPGRGRKVESSTARRLAKGA